MGLPNETVEKPFAWEIFTKISHNRLKNRQNVLQNIKNKALFNVSVPLFKDQFLKRDFFDSFNGMACILENRISNLKYAFNGLGNRDRLDSGRDGSGYGMAEEHKLPLR